MIISKLFLLPCIICTICCTSCIQQQIAQHYIPSISEPSEESYQATYAKKITEDEMTSRCAKAGYAVAGTYRTSIMFRNRKEFVKAVVYRKKGDRYSDATVCLFQRNDPQFLLDERGYAYVYLRKDDGSPAS